ncbi:MAG: DegT/DnrJ/EryC1/StrS family aminotransferase [Candidatus Aminicenantes bacterium]|nr:DegT/DnrJ/EryC1/StrS family aminotransferase [Candidatus Aminicenantes bacterium]
MRFRIGFDPDDRKKVHDYWDEIFTTQQWTEGKFTAMFEEKWAAWNGLPAHSFGSWSGAALTALEFFKVKGKIVLCPSNTFMATPLSVVKAGARVEFVDCNREDLCLSFEDLKRKVERFKPAAVWVVHIGGHIAFEIEEISRFCKERRIVLLEDCAHAHGASWNGRKPGSWGEAGIYSFYATKTITTGEGGILVSANKDLQEFSKQSRNYGKPDFTVEGLNYRINEFAAALGVVQVDRMADIVAWKKAYAEKHLDPKFPNRVKFPEGMISGYYKYIIFDPVEKSTGKVYDQPCHKIMNRDDELPNTDWVAKNHWCVPLYYKGE